MQPPTTSNIRAHSGIETKSALINDLENIR